MAWLRDRLTGLLCRRAGHELLLRLTLRGWAAFDSGLAPPLATLRFARYAVDPGAATGRAARPTRRVIG